ncbi:carbonic anhydrase [Nitratiruptor sp. YY08-26]|uniref:carbonic anhydrase n=1 Tax=unclassified Nitratiruptor TaxID=2624044 RepID=UPI001914E430|nr:MULTISPECIES: carbonic anhydrase [unclassified Nitratiruptor]BCD62850.1 carbonic anhydrase [Nitratiruptor sp. YY08-13]BCD66786.1 carbonic anhydrase [Nitratiruptor sp. YY08-26]
MHIKKFIDNYQEFKRIHFKKYEKLFEELASKGQSPKTLFIGCSDSRVVPDLITGAKPGDLFVFRNIGNFVPSFKPDNDFHATASAIEYAVSVLEVRDIIICGHSHCGACESLYKEIPQNIELIHIKKWLEIGEPAKEIAIDTVGTEDNELLLRTTEKASILVQLQNLLTYPAVKERVEADKLFLHGWYYKIESGEIEYFDEEEGDFKPIEP